MLTFRATEVKHPSFWQGGIAYAICHDDEPIGRVDIPGKSLTDGETRIELRGRAYGSRVQITGKAHWTYVPSRWAMRSDGRDLHAALWESGKTWLTEPDDATQPLRLRRSTFGGLFALERAADRTVLGEIRWLKPRLLPTPIPRGVGLETGLILPETLAVFLLWLVVQDDCSNAD